MEKVQMVTVKLCGRWQQIIICVYIHIFSSVFREKCLWVSYSPGAGWCRREVMDTVQDPDSLVEEAVWQPCGACTEAAVPFPCRQEAEQSMWMVWGISSDTDSCKGVGVKHLYHQQILHTAIDLMLSSYNYKII